MKIILAVVLFLVSGGLVGQTPAQQTPPGITQIEYRPGARPDRIVLTITGDPLHQRTVTWRTNGESGILQLASTSSDAEFYKKDHAYTSMTHSYSTFSGDLAVYHRVDLDSLVADSWYSYRVGDGSFWSEWFDFKTTGDNSNESWEMVFLGDAQNDLYSTWSRVFRAAMKKAPDAELVLHAGDLINHSLNDYEWAEWFYAGGPWFAEYPQLAVPGNHEYIKNEEGVKLGISPLWGAQFNFPKNGPEGLEDQAYYLDYRDVRFIALDSNGELEKQTRWLKQILQENPQKWTVAMFHHPVLSGAEDRVNEGVLNFWKPILDSMRVDLVLQGHDHVYARGNEADSGLGKWNENSGTMYVVAVSGRKMYELGKLNWMQQKAQNTPTYQVIRFAEDRLEFKAYSWDHRIFDQFVLIKNPNGPNLLVDNP
ncbi:metallophosphoesterase family protein [Algoriphagus confluentis]|uniref:Metallophosphoesterase family protein n=1 Tax=Algoriphagus confluentis TaxID=1697556 RepID=A0ABQ6PM04_9BACT|nr:metallophosphoesterase family protein [Algoriphagus confluentis]